MSYGFDPGRGVAWLEAFTETSSAPGRLCRRHADAMVVPQGWWLEDRRVAEHLFAAPTSGEKPVRPPPRPRPAIADVVPLPLGDDGSPPTDAEQPETESAEPALVAVATWTPTFAADDDLGGVLNATSPLLSRAFGRVRASGTRPRPTGA